MSRVNWLCGGSTLAMAAVACLTAGVSSASAQATGTSADAAPVTEVIVTGSFIRGVKTSALPVAVISAEDIQKQGSPTTLELLKALPISNGVLGDTNQFDARAQGSEGSGSVNLRGLGAQRTLVLLNGRRLAINPLAEAGSGIVDTNIIPAAAIGRIEVLKDGAAATYGSDAIAGVVNFITKKNQQGLEVSGDYKYVNKSDGDYNFSATYGWTGDRANLLLSAGYQHRSTLAAKDRSFINQPFLNSPEGGYSAAGNPSSFVNLSNGQIFRDPQCATLGGFAGFSGAVPVCYFQFTQFDNLVEKQDRVQLYGELNVDITDKTKFHAEALYAHTDVPEYATSPSYALLSTPTAEAEPSAAFTGRYFVPGTNPGLIDFIAKNPSFAGIGVTGAFVVAARPYALGGNPLFGNRGSVGSRSYDAFRVSAGFNGELVHGINYDTALTYSQESGIRTGYDTLVNRFELALRGLGGPNCNVAANTPGANNCLYFNPFSTAVASNAITGQTNPQFNPAVANSAALTQWFFQKSSTKQTSRLFVADAVFNGGLGINLPGGEVKWALGGQYRRTYFLSSYSALGNALVTPCVNTPDFGVTTCSGSTRNGPFAFLGVGTPADVTNDVIAGFGELSLPITSKLQGSFAARYEDYGGAVGSTFNPKGSLRFQATDWLALRGSVGSTFRGPPDTALVNNSVTSLQSILGVFRAVDIFGNPNLKPETATTYNFGLIFSKWGFHATLDYYRFDFGNPIVAEPVSGIVNAVFPNGAALPNNCATPSYAALVSRFTFNGACGPATITRLRTQVVNGAAVQTDGIDFDADYRIPDFFNGSLTLGTNLTYVIEYKVGATSVEGITVSPAFDAAGTLNYQTTVVPIPKFKGDFYAEYTRGPHNLRVTAHYIDSYTDQRTTPFIATPNTNNTVISNGKTIDSNLTVDLAYRVFLPWKTTLTASIINIADQDPSFARLDLNYDPFTGNPLGREFKIGVSKKF